MISWLRQVKILVLFCLSDLFHLDLCFSVVFLVLCILFIFCYVAICIVCSFILFQCFDQILLLIITKHNVNAIIHLNLFFLRLDITSCSDNNCNQTAEPDIFVGGDVYTGPKFAIDAIAAGKQGAISIHRFVQPQSSLTIGRNRNDFIELDKNDIKVENYDNSSRQIPGHNDAIDTKHSFRDAKLLFTEEQVKAETARCLGCGASVVDPNKCIGCGLCTTKCEFDAIKLHRELPECSRMVPYEDRLKFVLPNMVKQSIKLKFKKK